MASFIHRILPKKGSDLAAFLFMFVMLWMIASFEFFIVLPEFHEPFSTWYLIHVVCGVFLFLNVFANLFQVIMTDITGANLALPSVLKPGWTYCPYCQMNAPPRAHHCHVCNVCVLRRDHHCVFAGKCVGHSNYRYYLFLALYLWIGALYANIFHWQYVTSIIGHFGWASMFTLLMPMLSWMLGYTTAFETFVTFMAGLSLFAQLMFSLLLFFQLNIISRGQTSYERKKKMKRLYDRGVANNFIEILGKKWYLSWLWPTLPSALPEDGTNYTQITESMKDM